MDFQSETNLSCEVSTNLLKSRRHAKSVQLISECIGKHHFFLFSIFKNLTNPSTHFSTECAAFRAPHTTVSILLFQVNTTRQQHKQNQECVLLLPLCPLSPASSLPLPPSPTIAEVPTLVGVSSPRCLALASAATTTSTLGAAQARV